MFSAFNPSKCTHTWSSGQLTLWHLGSSWGFGALLKGLTSVVDNPCRSRDSNPQPQVTSPMLYTLGHDCPLFKVFSCVLYVNLKSDPVLIIIGHSYYMYSLNSVQQKFLTYCLITAKKMLLFWKKVNPPATA